MTRWTLEESCQHFRAKCCLHVQAALSKQVGRERRYLNISTEKCNQCVTKLGLPHTLASLSRPQTLEKGAWPAWSQQVYVWSKLQATVCFTNCCVLYKLLCASQTAVCLTNYCVLHKLLCALQTAVCFTNCCVLYKLLCALQTAVCFTNFTHQPKQ